MRILVTCPFGLSSMLGQEMKLLGQQTSDTFATGTYVEGEWHDVRKINLRTRIANKVSVSLGMAVCSSFEDMFQLAQGIVWEDLVMPGQGIEVEVFVHDKDGFTGLRSVQSVVHKAILKRLAGENDLRDIVESISPLDISVHITGQQVEIFVNTSGAPLHQRGRRTSTGEAPLKENLAAALVLMSGRKYRELLRDPCCGSGTIPIEAACIARNIAPGMLRNFAFQQFASFDKGIREEIRTDAVKKQYADMTYKIIGSDINETVLGYARQHAEAAGVADTITREIHDVMEWQPEEAGRIVSNPPYDKRLALTQKGAFYRLFAEHFVANRRGALLLPYEEETDSILGKMNKKEVKNGGIACRVYRVV